MLHQIISTDAPLEGKTVFLAGGEGPLGVALQCLIERNGMVAFKSHWSSNSLQRQVCVFFFSFSTICVLKSIFINVSFNLVLYMKVCSFQNLFKMTNHIAFIADKSLSSSYARHTQSLVAPVTVCAVLVADHMESVSAFSKSLPRHVMSCKTFFRFKSSDVISSPVLIF